MEVSGPTSGDVICRVSRYSNDVNHLCVDNAAEFCHVVTLRVGPHYGTMLWVDHEPQDRNNTPVPVEQAYWFGGGAAPAPEAGESRGLAPYFNTSLMREVRALPLPTS